MADGPSNKNNDLDQRAQKLLDSLETFGILLSKKDVRNYISELVLTTTFYEDKILNKLKKYKEVSNNYRFICADPFENLKGYNSLSDMCADMKLNPKMFSPEVNQICITLIEDFLSAYKRTN